MNDLTTQRTKLLNDPTTQAIATALGQNVETYVERVLAFVADPELEPELTLDEQAPGPDPVSLDAALEAASVDDPADAFVSPPRPLVVF